MLRVECNLAGNKSIRNANNAGVNKTGCLQPQSPKTVIEADSQLIKTYYLSFGEAGAKTKKKQPDDPQDVNKIIKSKLKGTGFSPKVKVLKQKDIIDFKPFDKTAEYIAMALSSDTNVDLIQNSGADSDLVAHSFAKLMYAGQFKNIGFSEDNTDVLIYPNEEEFEYVKLEKIAQDAKKAKRKKVVFLKTFVPMMLTAKCENDFMYFVGMRPELDDHEKFELDRKDPDAADALEDWIAKTKSLTLYSPSASEAKEYLLKNKKIIRDELKKYPAKIKLTDEAICKIIEYASSSTEGEFPQKALDLLNSVVPAVLLIKTNKAPKDMEITSRTLIDAKKIKSEFTIDEKDVIKAVEAFPSILNTRVSADGNFSSQIIKGESFSDIGGMNETKDEIQERIINYLENPAVYKKHNVDIPKGVLFYGPSGTGKTMLARIVASQTNVPLISCSGSNFVEIWVGQGAARVRELVELAYDVAEKSDKKSCIVFIDEIESLAQSRDMPDENSEDRKTINQLLNSMDGMDSKSKKVNVIFIGATNRLKDLDTAVLRPGRFDVQIKVDIPANYSERLSIFTIHSKDRLFRSEAEKQKLLELAAKKTEGFSGAEIKDLMNKASNFGANREVKGQGNLYITEEDILAAVKYVKSKKENFEKEQNAAIKMPTIKPDDLDMIYR